MYIVLIYSKFSEFEFSANGFGGGEWSARGRSRGRYPKGRAAASLYSALPPQKVPSHV